MHILPPNFSPSKLLQTERYIEKRAIQGLLVRQEDGYLVCSQEVDQLVEKPLINEVGYTN